MLKHRMFKIAAVLVTTMGAAGQLTVGSAGAAVTHTGHAVGSHAKAHVKAHVKAADLVSPSSAAARPADSTDPIHIQQTTNQGFTYCMDSSRHPLVYWNACSSSNTEAWTRQASTNGQEKIVNGTLCLDYKVGIASCSQGDGYQKFTLVLLSDGFEWKIESPQTGITYCLTLQNGAAFTKCQKGDGAQKFTFPSA